MADDSPERIVPLHLDLIVRRGVGRTLFAAFLGLAVVPLLLVGWFGYQAAYTRLEDELHHSLRVAAEWRSHQLKGYLNGCLADAGRQGRLPATIAFFNLLERNRREADQLPGEELPRGSGAAAVATLGSGIQLHADLHGYKDILVIDPGGGVLFSSTVREGVPVRPLPSVTDAAGLAAAFRKALETGAVVFSGFSPDVAPSGAVSAYVAAPIGRADDDPLGAIAFEIPGSTIQQMLETPVEGGLDATVYLIDARLNRLAGTLADGEPQDRLTADTPLTRKWQGTLADGPPPSTPAETMTYIGPDGRLKTATYASMRPGGIPYALVVEVDRPTAFATITRLRTTLLAILFLTGVAALVVSASLARSIVQPMHDLTQSVEMATQGVLNGGIAASTGNELARLAAACGDMAGRLTALRKEHETQSRFMAGLASLHRLIGGEQVLGELCLKTLEFLSDFLDLAQADLYVADESGGFRHASHFPGQAKEDADRIYYAGDGRVGQAVLKQSMTPFRKDDDLGLVMPVPSADVANLLVVPLVLRQTVKGVLELEKATVFSIFESRYLVAAAELVAMALGAALTRRQEMALLAQTRRQADKLKAREAALEASARELLEQSRAFQASQQKLQLKQLELEAANAQMIKNAADLEGNMAILERQKQDMQRQNAELEKTHRQLAEKARQLEISSRYKTEFMANMSHELRTPLNSILLLSRLLLENKERTLTTRQLEFARTVNSAGEDLLTLINEILDLAKVESGKMEVDLAPVKIQSIADAMQVSFAPLADQSGVSFSIHVAPGVPEQVTSDRTRIEQIVKNFLSNAFKFTSQGSIRLEMAVTREPVVCRPDAGGDADGCLSISVVDTGIGIPPDKHDIVFEAFQQVDGSTRRKYGGTGLGLSISRELARLLGGEITLESQPGRGSRFSLHLPIVLAAAAEPAAVRESVATLPPVEPPAAASLEGKGDPLPGIDPVPDDRHKLSPGEPSVLIIATDAETVEPINTFAHRHGVKVLVAETIPIGLHFADYYQPSALFAGPPLPDADGWEVVGCIKANPRCRHIPVFALSLQNDGFAAAVAGAAGIVPLPPSPASLETAFRQFDTWRRTADRTILVVDPDPQGRGRIAAAIGTPSVRLIGAGDADAAAAVVDNQKVAAVIVHPALPDDARHRLFAALERDPTPVFIYSGAPLVPRIRGEISRFARSVNLAGVDSADQLLQSLLACLHLSPDLLTEESRARLRVLDDRRTTLKGRRVLLVDDDMRTVFAVSSALEDQGVDVYTGKSGKETLDKLDGFPDIDLVLMDVMIAEVDGYQALSQLRARDRYRRTPILALTAKAMQGDRSKCIAAGADDYLAKPVNLDKLTSMLRVWLAPWNAHRNQSIPNHHAAGRNACLTTRP